MIMATSMTQDRCTIIAFATSVERKQQTRISHCASNSNMLLFIHLAQVSPPQLRLSALRTSVRKCPVPPPAPLLQRQSPGAPVTTARLLHVPAPVNQFALSFVTRQQPKHAAHARIPQQHRSHHQRERQWAVELLVRHWAWDIAATLLLGAIWATQAISGQAQKVRRSTIYMLFCYSTIS
jgi:hypothetical protein